MKKFLIPTIFWALAGVFLVTVSEFFIPAFRELLKGSLLFLLAPIIFFLLGIILVFLTIKGEMKRIFKGFLILTGSSAAGFFISILLHNLFYGLATVTNHISILNYLMKIFHIAFFFIAIFVCPLSFLVGVVGSIVLFIKNKNRF